MSICKLCGQDKPLIRSHIFPDWGYRYLKEENHFFQLMGTVKARKVQTGYWDRNILCNSCDGDIIGKYDTYAAQFFKQDFTKLLTTYSELGRKSKQAYHVKNFDYPKLYAFLISLLWRASITNHPTFSKVQLGPYEKLAREIVFTGIPKHEDQFKIAVFVPEQPKFAETFEKSIVHPFRSKFGEADCYRFVFAGFDFVVKVDSRKSNLHVDGISIDPNGFNIIKIPFDGSTIGKVVNAYKRKFRTLRDKK